MAISPPKVYYTTHPEQVYTNWRGVIILNIIRDYFKYKSTFTSNVPVDVFIFLIQLDNCPYEETEEDNIPYANIIVENVEESEVSRGEFYLSLKAQAQKNIEHLV